MTPKMNFCAMFSSVIYKISSVKVMRTLKEHGNNDSNNRETDNRSCSGLFLLTIFQVLSVEGSQVKGSC